MKGVIIMFEEFNLFLDQIEIFYKNAEMISEVFNSNRILTMYEECQKAMENFGKIIQNYSETSVPFSESEAEKINNVVDKVANAFPESDLSCIRSNGEKPKMTLERAYYIFAILSVIWGIITGLSSDSVSETNNTNIETNKINVEINTNINIGNITINSNDDISSIKAEIEEVLEEISNKINEMS